MSTESASDQRASSGEFVTSGSARGRAAVRRRRSRIVLYGVLGIMVVLGVGEFPREVSRWYYAAALESLEQGELAQAVAHADGAVDWDPHGWRPLGLRAQLRLEAGELEASLADCNRAIERAPAGLDPYFTRTLVYQRLGRHAEAVGDWDFIVATLRAQHAQDPSATSERLANALNGRAYARALGKTDIEKGLDDIDEALDVLGTEESSHMLDTRGYLRYLKGDLPAARADLERALELAETSAQLGLLRQAGSVSAGHVLVPDIRTRHELAVLYYHRGLIYEKLGKPEEAKADMELADKLGYDPENGVW